MSSTTPSSSTSHRWYASSTSCSSRPRVSSKPYMLHVTMADSQSHRIVCSFISRCVHTAVCWLLGMQLTLV